MNPFFVTGLPRSRSAWLAAWLTTDRSFCYHDRKFLPGMVGGPRLAGFSGPELVDQFASIQQQYPCAPWIVVLRKAEDAFQAFVRVAKGKVAPTFDLDAFWEKRRQRLADMCEKPQVQAVRFDDMDREEVARFIWNTCLPNIEFDRPRWELFNGLRICQKEAN
jgi:hypothetical protein